MAKLSKRMRAIAEKIDADKAYGIDEAVALLNELAGTKFKESFDISVNLGVDPRKSDQVVRGATTLPHGTGKTVRVAVFAQGENAEKALAAGADLVGFDDLAEKVKGGEMPNPKTGTVTPDVVTAVNNAKAGQVQFRTDKAGIIHGSVGQVGFEPLQIRENVEALMSDLRKAKPASAKGIYLKKVTLSTTMGPGVSIDQATLQAV